VGLCLDTGLSLLKLSFAKNDQSFTMRIGQKKPRVLQLGAESTFEGGGDKLAV
jgi:hypothetical protein